MGRRRKVVCGLRSRRRTYFSKRLGSTFSYLVARPATSPRCKMRPPVSEEGNEVVVFNDGHGTLRLSAPDCEVRGPYFSQHWATDIQPLGTTDEERTFRLPWLHPECDALANYKVGHGLKPYASRVSKHGLVVLRRGDRENVSELREPHVKDISSISERRWIYVFKD